MRAALVATSPMPTFSTRWQALKSAISRHFQGASQQRCQVHYSRNLLGMVRPQAQGARLRSQSDLCCP
jgi:transposase-like protein